MLFSTLIFALWLSVATLAGAHPSIPFHPPTRLHELPKHTSEFISPLEPKKFERRNRDLLKPHQAPPSPIAHASSPADQRHILSVDPSSFNTSAILKTISAPPIHCFNPYSTGIEHAKAEDCRVIIHHIILSYPNPMLPQTFGYNDEVDIDLRERDNAAWDYGICVIFVRNEHKSRVDTFRMADVAAAANRVTDECIEGKRYAVGGSTDVGSSRGFFVGVGGFPGAGATGES